MVAPLNLPEDVKRISIYLPKREELSLRMVRALPNASRIGLESRTCCSTRI